MSPGPRSVGARLRRRRLGVIIAVVIVLVAAIVAAATGVWRSRSDSGLAGEAVVTASSTALGFSARNVVDTGSASSPGAGWQSDAQTSGSWLELAWPQAHPLRKITIVRNEVRDSGVTDGFLSFSDGSYLQVQLSHTSPVTVIPFTPRSVNTLRFTASGVSPGATSVFIAELVVSAEPSDDDIVTGSARDGNVAPSATVSSSGASAGGSDPRALQDGSGSSGVTGAGADWTVSRPVGAWVQLDWSRPRELTSIQLLGAAGSTADLASATLTFGDGSQLPIGAVLADPDLPTTVSFLPRVTQSVRLTIDRVSGAGALSLGELRAYQRGAVPVRSSAQAPPDSPPAAGVTCDSPTAGAPESGLLVRCPLSGSAVDGTVDFQIAAATGYSSVTATVWPAEESAPVGPPVQAALNPAGAAGLTVDLTRSPAGPLTVQFEATGPDMSASTVYFQLYHGGLSNGTGQEGAGGSSGDVPSSAAAAGRSLVYAEEFDRPVSISRTGLGAEYAGAKPTDSGPQDFGDAIFPDDALGFHNERVVDNRYLRIDVEPTPPGLVDPSGARRTHLGGLLASARPGGSGFSAQYGYFEARMLAPAAPGTWPAFWMLPSDNLVGPTPVVAEIDAVELYGHYPLGACQSTHQYLNGKDSGIAQCGQRFTSARAALSWHTYGVSILPTGITFYIDGRVVTTAPQVQGGGAPMFFLVDLALGGGWPVQLQAVQDRAELYVDYVRVYV